MRGLKSKIVSSIKSKKINVFLLFLVLSFIILILSKLSKTYTNTVTFDITKTNVPEDSVILSDSTTKLQITLKAFGFKILQYYLKTPKLSIDFGDNIYKNDSVYIWSREKGFSAINSQFDKQIEIITINPDTLFFKYDKNMVKKVPIKLNTDILFSPGFDVKDSYKLVPDSIKIIGPSKEVSAIKSITTDKISLKNVKSDILKMINLQIPDSIPDIKFSDSKVELSAVVEKFTEGKLKIPITVKNVPDSISLKYFPKEVMVSYYTSLSDFNNITAKDFVIACDYSKINSEQSFLIPEIVQKPKAVKNTRLAQNRVEFIIIE